jgi:SnoaL-like domain
MTDGEAILQLLNLYAFAIDAKQWHLFDRIFTPDAAVDYPHQKWDSGAAFRDDFDVAHRVFDATQHLISNVNWLVDGDTGSAVSQAHFHLIRRHTPGGDVAFGGAWYDDLLTRTDAGWRIARRTCRVTWLGGNAGAIPGFDREAYQLSSMSQGVHDGTLTFDGTQCSELCLVGTPTG